MNPSTYRISRSSRGSRRQPVLDTGLEPGGIQPGAFRMEGNRPSENDDIVSVTMADSDVDDSAPAVAEETMIRVPEARVVDPNETEEAVIARAVHAAREQTERSLRAELALRQEETQERQLLQQRDKPPTPDVDNSCFRIQSFLHNHAFLASVLCSILLLSAVGAGLWAAFSSKKESLHDVPSLPPSVTTQMPTELPTVSAATPSPSVVNRSSFWTQVGSTLTGAAKRDNFGDSNALALSSDGSILAVGAPLNDVVADNSGLVEVYRRGRTSQQQTEEWQPMGAALALAGVVAGDRFGSSVALSANGQILAVGASESYSGRPGCVRVFEYDTSSGQWNSRGSHIVGVAALDEFGTSVALSSDGNILAVGALHNDDNGQLAGHVRVFAFDSISNEWVQEGSTLTGVNAFDRFGWIVDLSADGRILAVGAISNGDNGTDSGHVRAFQFNNNFNDWDQLGAAIPGVAEGDAFGRSVALSANGMVLAAGAGNNNDNGLDSGHVRVLDYNTSADQWILRGSAIVGVAENDAFGWSVALSADGNQVAAGALWNDAISTNSGHIRVFRYEESSGGTPGKWMQVGEALTGVGGEQDQFGRSVVTSADGWVVAGGASEGNNDFLDPGYVIVYEGVGE